MCCELDNNLSTSSQAHGIESHVWVHQQRLRSKMCRALCHVAWHISTETL
jgi:hypothetical protein